MNESDYPWFKLYPEVMKDEKLILAAARTHHTFLEVLGAWTMMLCIAARSPIRGVLMLADQVPCLETDLAILCHLEIESMDLLIRAFQQMEMIDCDESTNIITLLNWEERQETKEDRIKRLHREAQDRYRLNKTITCDGECDSEMIAGDADVMHDSISISISKSLINDSDSENSKLFTYRDVEKALMKVLNIFPLPSTYNQHLEQVLDLLQHYGWDKTIDRLTTALTNWKAQKNKTNGQPYRLTNPAWIDLAITGECIGAPQVPKDSVELIMDKMRREQEQREKERNQ
jgi:hypothetical protein